MNERTRALIVEALMTAAHTYMAGVDHEEAKNRKSPASKLMTKASRVAEIAQLLADGEDEFVFA